MATENPVNRGPRRRIQANGRFSDQALTINPIFAWTDPKLVVSKDCQADIDYHLQINRKTSDGIEAWTNSNTLDFGRGLDHI